MASALSRPLNDARQRADFTVKVTADKHRPGIEDVQLLPGGRLLLADWNNMCVKLFDTQGQHLHTLECRSEPCSLAVLDSSSIRHTVAVTLPDCRGIDILEVNGDNMEVKGQHLHTLECRSEPCSLAVLDSSSIRHTVAVTLPGCRGIDILKVNGDNMEVKRTLQMSRGYDAVAAVSNLTLAVGYRFGPGIDLIDLGGQVLRQI
ncbi:hypothetical protein PoB_000767500, partial [Plakobranchus ocellatus]